MSTQNAMRRVKIANLDFKAKRLRREIEDLTKTICINLDCGLVSKPDDLPVDVIDSQWDQLKEKWAELISANNDIKRLEEELK